MSGGVNDRPGGIGYVNPTFGRSNGSGGGAPDKGALEELKKVKADIATLFSMVLELKKKVERLSR